MDNGHELLSDSEKWAINRIADYPKIENPLKK
jgi:hypothetical protein